jgi:hypothetical protein
MDTRKIVIHAAWGGYGLTDEIHNVMKQLGSDEHNPERDNPILVKAVERLLRANPDKEHYYGLKVVEIPFDVEWEIKEYDGWEHVAEAHRTWE